MNTWINREKIRGKLGSACPNLCVDTVIIKLCFATRVSHIKIRNKYEFFRFSRRFRFTIFSALLNRNKRLSLVSCLGVGFRFHQKFCHSFSFKLTPCALVEIIGLLVLNGLKNKLSNHVARTSE